ncbi:PE-PGRS family protein [Austwickia sp. TVS 96-490-7B]|nr:PE-PGRS family protein [Austwickia sp. TVS 96-490-7B]
MRLLLIRHGQTSSNVIHALDTAFPGADLTDMGRQQAAAIPAALADEPIDAIYASALVRTQQTAAPLAAQRGLEVQVRAGLAEIAAGIYEMRHDEEAIRAYVDAVFSWQQDPSRAVPGGENMTQVISRCDEVVQEIAAAGHRTAVIFSHGAMIRTYAAARADNISFDVVAPHWLSNTGMVVLEGDPRGGWEMTGWCAEPLGGAHLDDPGAGDPTVMPQLDSQP